MVDAVDRHHTIGYLSNSKLIQGWLLVYIRTPTKQEKKTANPDRKMGMEEQPTGSQSL